MGMSQSYLDSLATACTALVAEVATNPTLSSSISSGLASGTLTPASGPIGVSNVLKGSPGGHHLQQFLKIWGSRTPHIESEYVSSMFQVAVACYDMARQRAHTVETVWTGPEVPGSEVRRTEAVVTDIVQNAQKEILIVGYWLVTRTPQIKQFIELLVEKARSGIAVRFVFDPGVKPGGPDNFSALDELWPIDQKIAPRELFTWSDSMLTVSTDTGVTYDRKLHAKVIAADRAEALVTSANLTQAGLVSNLEMGFRINGTAAAAVVRHFDLLIDREILNQYL